jgi:hypothetical protein
MTATRIITCASELAEAINETEVFYTEKEHELLYEYARRGYPATDMNDDFDKFHEDKDKAIAALHASYARYQAEYQAFYQAYIAKIDAENQARYDALVASQQQQ